MVDKTQLYDGESCGPGLVSLFVKLSVYFTYAAQEMPRLVPLTTNSSWSFLLQQDSGYPSVRVPLEHMTDGIPETDTVIYISVSFKDPNLNSGGGGGGGGDESDTLFTTSATLPSLNHLHRSAIIQHGENDKKYNNETE